MSKRITLISFIGKNEISKVEQLMSNVKENFEPFFVEFNKLALFDYPGEIIKKIDITTGD